MPISESCLLLLWFRKISVHCVISLRVMISEIVFPRTLVLATIKMPIFPWCFHSHNLRLLEFPKRGSLKERPDCMAVFPTEFLSCFSTIHSRSPISRRRRVRSPRYTLTFQPHPAASGIEVEATRNRLGAGISCPSWASHET